MDLILIADEAAVQPITRQQVETAGQRTGGHGIVVGIPRADPTITRLVLTVLPLRSPAAKSRCSRGADGESG